MKINAKARYAVTALTELGRHGAFLRIGACGQADTQIDLSPLPLSEIATSHDISLSFLEQMFRDLKKADLVQSLRGVKGGYVLTAAPSRLSLIDIFRAIDEAPQTTACGDQATCFQNTKCSTHDLWAAMGDHIELFLTKLSLADVIDGSFDISKTQPEHINFTSTILNEVRS